MKRNCGIEGLIAGIAGGYRNRTFRGGKALTMSGSNGSGIVKMTGVVLLAIALAWVTALARASTDIKAFLGADEVQITGNSTAHTDGDKKIIVDRDAVSTLYRFVSQQPNDWQRPQFDEPLLRWSVSFFKNGKLLGTYGVGQNFIELDGRLHTLTPPQQQRIVSLLKSTHAD